VVSSPDELDRLVKSFPGLADSEFEARSPHDLKYNCVAFTAGDAENWWWPRGPCYWPKDVPREETIQCFEEALQTLGFERLHWHQTLNNQEYRFIAEDFKETGKGLNPELFTINNSMSTGWCDLF
jgi:hypothetical protein